MKHYQIMRTVMALMMLTLATGLQAQAVSAKTPLLDPQAPGSVTHAHPYGAGKAIFVPNADGAFASVLAALDPDVRFATPDPRIGFVHRKLADRDVYLFANIGTQPTRIEASLRSFVNTGAQPAIGETSLRSFRMGASLSMVALGSMRSI